MEVIKISKQKHIQFCLLTMSAIALIFMTALWYILALRSVDWVFNLKFTVIFFTVLAGDVVVPLCVFLILRAVNKCFYVISSDGIKLFKSDKEIFSISNVSILRLGYLGFQYALLMQMGAGYLSVQYTEAYGQIKPTMTFPNGCTLLGIDMSAKQAQQVAQILGKDLQH